LTKITRELARQVHKKAEELGGWDKHGVKTAVCKAFPDPKTGKPLSRPTLDALLEQFPEFPEEKYKEYEDFYKIPEIDEFSKIANKQEVKYLQECWLALERKNPMNWKSEDLAILRKHIDLIHPKTGFIKFEKLLAVRKFLRQHNTELFRKEEKGLLFTKRTKPPEGLKREWFLTTDELNRFLVAIDDLEFLTQVTCQVKWGCRHSALNYKGLTPSQIQPIGETEGGSVAIANVYEPKTRKTWQKWMHKTTMHLLGTYIKVRNLKQDDPLFPKSLTWYNNNMKLYGTKAGVCKYERIKYKDKKGRIRHKWKYLEGIPMSSHLFRHTFAFLCSDQGIPLEETAELGGWDDVNTLKKFYFYVPPEKLRKRYESIDWKKPTSTDKRHLIDIRDQPPSDEELKALEKEEP